MAAFGSFRVSLVCFESFWVSLNIIVGRTASFWHVFVRFGSVWILFLVVLVYFVSFWISLVRFRSVYVLFWLVLGCFTLSLLVLGGFGSYFGFFWVVLARFRSVWILCRIVLGCFVLFWVILDLILGRFGCFDLFWLVLGQFRSLARFRLFWITWSHFGLFGLVLGCFDSFCLSLDLILGRLRAWLRRICFIGSKKLYIRNKVSDNHGCTLVFDADSKVIEKIQLLKTIYWFERSIRSAGHLQKKKS